MPASRKTFKWCETVGCDRSKSGTSSQTQTLPACFRQHVHELQAHRIAERFGNRRHPLGPLALDIGVDDRLATALAGRALLLGR